MGRGLLFQCNLQATISLCTCYVLDQCWPMEIEWELQMQATCVVLNFPVATLKDKETGETDFNK